MKHFKNILYVGEAASPSESSLARAVSLARNNQARLSVVDVVPEQPAGAAMPAGGPSPAALVEALESRCRAALDSLIAASGEQLEIDVDVLRGRKFIELIRKVLRDRHDLVIKPAEDPSWLDRLFGSEDLNLLRKCPCPVWMMKPNESANYRRILAAVDFDPGQQDPDEDALNTQILELAGSLALSDFAELHLVHVWDAPEAGFASLWSEHGDAAEARLVEAVGARHEAGMRQLSGRLRDLVGKDAYDYLTPRVHLPQGQAEREIPALVKRIGADLVVMGTLGRSGIPGLLIGNTAETVLYGLQTSVLAVKPPGFVSPVPPA